MKYETPVHQPHLVAEEPFGVVAVGGLVPLPPGGLGNLWVPRFEPLDRIVYVPGHRWHPRRGEELFVSTGGEKHIRG